MTLVEMMIVFSLSGIVLYATHVLLFTGVRYYNESMDSLDVQREALLAITKLAQDLSGSNFEKIRTDTVPVDGIVYPTIRDINGQFITDDGGAVMWQGMAAYHVDDVGGSDFLVKKYLPLPGGMSSSPPGAYDYSPPFDLNYFVTNISAGGPVARNVIAFVPNLEVDTVQLTLTVSLTSNTTRDTNSIALQSKAFPRN